MIARNEAGGIEQFFRIFRFERAQKRIAGRRSEAQPKPFHGVTIEAAILEIGHGDFALGALVQAAREKRRSFPVHFNERGTLLIFAALFRRTLARLWNGDATFFGDGAHRFGKSGFLQLHHEFEKVAARAAAEAVINLPHGMHGK